MITRNGFPGVVNPGWRYPVVAVYTDACKSTRRAGLGIVVSDRGHRRVSSAVCPAALQLAFDRRGFIINQLELMAVLCCLLTYGECLRGRRVLWFIDNCAAMSSCVHG